MSCVPQVSSNPVLLYLHEKRPPRAGSTQELRNPAGDLPGDLIRAASQTSVNTLHLFLHLKTPSHQQGTKAPEGCGISSHVSLWMTDSLAEASEGWLWGCVLRRSTWGLWPPDI